MDPGVQQEVKELWPQVTSENLRETTDFEGYQEDFLKLFGFGFSDVDFDQEITPVVHLEV